MSEVKKMDIGLIGLATMGANLARNLSSKKIRTIVFNRTSEKTESFIHQYGNSYLEGENNLKKFIQKIKRPRKIILMVKAGQAVDDLIKKLTPLLHKDDILIDCGNSYFGDTEKRLQHLKQKKLHFVGCGISGGEEGALHGPSLMPGGEKKTWLILQPIFEVIAAKDFHKKPCVTYIGPGASGHYIKMVHNGIEYGIMQLMAESYEILRKIYQLSAPQIADIFQILNKGKLNSYLFEIAAKVLKYKDKKGYLIDYILDKAEQKGTGAWTTQEALAQNIALPTITEAVFARFLSADPQKRASLHKLYPQQKITKVLPLNKFIPLLENALYGAILSTYAQGYDLIRKASDQNQWNINLAEISRIWEGGCIIRAKILNFLSEAYTKNSQKHLFEIPQTIKGMKSSLPGLQEVVSLSAKNAIPVPTFAASLFYFETMTTLKSPANFIQALRDYFGAHSYERTDKPGQFHTHWDNI